MFFIFDAKKYLKDNEYKTHCNARLEKIYRECKNEESCKLKNVYCLASHADVIRKEEGRSYAQITNELKTSVQEKDYSSVFKNIIVLDITNQTDVDKFKDQINLNN